MVPHNARRIAAEVEVLLECSWLRVSGGHRTIVMQRCCLTRTEGEEGVLVAIHLDLVVGRIHLHLLDDAVPHRGTSSTTSYAPMLLESG